MTPRSQLTSRHGVTMKTKLILAVLVAAIAILPTACRSDAPADGTTASAKKADIYYCPMHPTVTSDRPGSCPICGMALVKRSESAGADAVAHLAESGATADPSLVAISLSPEQRITANVQTVRVTLDTHTGEIVTTGRVTFDERRIAQVTSYTGGRIERLFVNFTGEAVRRGQSVAAIYSPDLFATQQEYLLAIANRERMRRAGFESSRSAADDLVESTRRRLLLSGMSAGQITQLEKSGQPIFATTVTSPVSGVVTRKLAVEQQYVAQGQPLFEVADLSQVWVEADVYEQQLADVSVGQQVQISVPSIPGRQFEGTVSFIVPVIAGATRTARVRIDLPNPGQSLKPDMYVNVRIIGAPAPAHMMLPPSAVIDRGRRQFVWVETQPNVYEPREVTTGGRHGSQVVILSGLNEGDAVVVEGGFLLDSEAQLRSATAGATSGGHEH